VEEGVGEDFFAQLWSCPEDFRKVPASKAGSVLVWIRKDLFEQRKFSREIAFRSQMEIGQHV
jgi:hypothetical protein